MADPRSDGSELEGPSELNDSTQLPNKINYLKKIVQRQVIGLWKLLSAIIAIKICRHVAQYMSRAQKGVGSDTRGDKHQLLVDRAVVRNSKTRMTNLCTAWIENKKAEDSPVKQISRTAFFHHSNIAKIRHILFHPAKLVNLFFTSRLDYCNFGGFLFFYDLGI